MQSAIEVKDGLCCVDDLFEISLRHLAWIGKEVQLLFILIHIFDRRFAADDDEVDGSSFFGCAQLLHFEKG